ncbi:MAG: hypothetical protein ACM3NQ_03570 [Bacteroidales bacterium]
MTFPRLWLAFALVVLVSFAVLGWVGVRIYQAAPPVPDRVVTPDGRVVMTGDDIRAGQNVWQSMGGMEMGSVWGHGSYVAPDWTADWLHRELTFALQAQAGGTAAYETMPAWDQARLQRQLQGRWRANTYDPQTRRVTIDPVRAQAFDANESHYADTLWEGGARQPTPLATPTPAR